MYSRIGAISPGNQTYSQRISYSLKLRWSTSADRAGCILLSCLAPGIPEGQESELALRYFTPYTYDAFHAGSSTNWAVCVDTSEITNTSSSDESSSSFVADIKQEAAKAKERVVALIYFLPAQFSFENGASNPAVGKAQIVACRTAFRQGAGGSNIMKGLFEMVHDRARMTGCAFMITSGIPSYYRLHGYEYAVSLGRGLVTHTSSLPPTSKSIPPDSPFSIRRASINDLSILESLVISSRDSRALFSGPSPGALHSQLSWLLGSRPPPFEGDSPFNSINPWFVLETKRRTNGQTQVVAAVGLQNQPNAKTPSPMIGVHPLLWNAKEDASAVVVAILQHLVPAVNEILKKDGESAELAKISWVLSDGHPLRPWLLAHELAVPVPETSLYDGNGSWWINIYSLPLFFKSLMGALNARLSRATHILGANYSAELRIAELRTSVNGVVVKITNSQIESVSVYKLSNEDLLVSAFGKSGPNVSLPRGALTQLLMGYRVWKDLRSGFPDAVASPHLVPLLEVLFPKLELASSMYS